MANYESYAEEVRGKAKHKLRDLSGHLLGLGLNGQIRSGGGVDDNVIEVVKEKIEEGTMCDGCLNFAQEKMPRIFPAASKKGS